MLKEVTPAAVNTVALARATLLKLQESSLTDGGRSAASAFTRLTIMLTPLESVKHFGLSL